MKTSIFLLALWSTPAAACTLMGVIASTLQAESIAAFSCEQDTRFLRIGGQVDGWTITAIHQRHVTLQKGKRTIEVMVGVATNEAFLVDVPIKDGFEIREDKIVITKALQEYIASTGLVSILMQTCSEPVDDADGSTKGYRLFEIDKGSAFDLIGIRENDIVTEIDGEKLTNPIITLSVLTRLKSLSKFTFKFERAGKSEERRVEVF